MKKAFGIFFTCLSTFSFGQFITNTGIQITNKTVVYTNGDWQNSGTLRNDGTIITSDSWQNAGTLDVNSTGGFVLQYATAKSFSAGSNSAKIGFIQKEGIGDAALTGKVYVTDSLKVLAGKMKANSAADTLGFFSTAFVYAANGSYVEGPMAWKGSGTNTLTFPSGKGGNYLPIKFNSATSKRVGVELQTAPVGYIAGDAVESLTGFPYAWNVVSANVADLANSIELQAPNALVSGIAFPIVVQKVNTNEFEGMGSQSTSSDGTNTKVVSYSNGLKGLFSIANGYSGSSLGDQAELVNLYNATSGGSWTNRTGWPTGDLANSFGVTVKGGRVTSIVMPNNNIVGQVPPTIINIAALKTLNLSSNKITSLPNLTFIPAMATPTATLNVSSNNLDFASLEANASLTGSVVYTNQAPVSVVTYNEIPVNSDTTMIIPVGGTTNQYQWKFKGRSDASYSPIAGANNDTYTVTSINKSKLGDYVLEITNPAVPGLVLTSAVNTLEATANISGTLKFRNTSSDDPVTSGEMRLLEVTSTGGYDTIGFDVNGVRDPNGLIKSVAVQPDGSYAFKRVLLRDYVVNGFPDTLVALYQKAIPTWFTRTIFWENADTLFLEGNIPDPALNIPPLDIVSEVRPDHPTLGFGNIFATFVESDGSGRVLGKKPVKKAAVAISRDESSGRGEAIVYKLVDYRFTNEDGTVNFEKLDAFQYRINLQYPGYPMDESSDIDLTIVDNLFERQVGVEAEVFEGKIRVRKLIITGWEERGHTLNAYPNPATDFVYITDGSDAAAQNKITLFSNSGKNINVPTYWNGIEKRWETDMRQLNKGVYFIQIKTQSRVEVLKVIID